MRRHAPILGPFLGALLIAAALPGTAPAQDRTPSHCIALAQGPERLMRAAGADPVPPETVRLHFVAHATFLIRTHGGLSLATDYTGHLGTAPLIPDVVTMNNAHSTHWTPAPDPGIPHVLPGWAPDGSAAERYLDLGEILIRNVPTTTRDSMGGERAFGNSIFVFEAAGLCIGHLGHLHHEPTPEQYAMLGRLDVVMAPVDGGLTLDRPTMIRVLKRLRSSIVLPMHWFGEATLQRFLDGMAEDFDITRPGGSEIEVSLSSLPARPTIVVLEPERLR